LTQPASSLASAGLAWGAPMIGFAEKSLFSSKTEWFQAWARTGPDK
jgi:hypothetical protein